MPRYKDEPPAVRVYTVCDESRYLIVKNVPALGCGDELLKLFSTYGEVEECKPMDEEDCEPFTDVYWIKFRLFSNARFAKRKLDDFVFLGNRLQVSYAPHFESLLDTKDKLEGRRREVLSRLNLFSMIATRRSKEPTALSTGSLMKSEAVTNYPQTLDSTKRLLIVDCRNSTKLDERPQSSKPPLKMVSSNEDYFASQSMNQTVRLVRQKLDKIQSTGEHIQAEPASKKARVDNRRRI
ncbi:RNA-binding protein 48 [Senna tora]|uniref:RNA-binding protein 48 n=1 Tax=Senna tora TaxID=362788 RepID=A0A834ST97_9FABA|nr:RNA-binding protein 48 [Senna tora]